MCPSHNPRMLPLIRGGIDVRCPKDLRFLAHSEADVLRLADILRGQERVGNNVTVQLCARRPEKRARAHLVCRAYDNRDQ
jgi:hypothetical protein